MAPSCFSFDTTDTTSIQLRITMNKKDSIKRKKRSKSKRKIKIKTEPPKIINLSSSSLDSSVAIFTRSFSINVRRISIDERNTSVESDELGAPLESVQITAKKLSLESDELGAPLESLQMVERKQSTESIDLGDLESLQMEDVTPAMESNDLSAQSEYIQKWYDEIYDHLRETNHLNILEDGGRIFIIKEVYFPLDVTSPDSSFVATLLMISASGLIAPPIVFFPFNESPPKNIFDDEPNTWTISEASKDSSTNDNLLIYMRDMFYPWLVCREIQVPVIVFLDTDPAHVSWDVINFCKPNRIMLLSTLSYEQSHPIQSFVMPLLEHAWNNIVIEWHSKNKNRQLTNDLIPPMLRQVFEKTITVKLLKAAFRRCGIFPFKKTENIPTTSTSSQPTLTFSAQMSTSTSQIPSTSQPALPDLIESSTQTAGLTPRHVPEEMDPLLHLLGIKCKEVLGPLVHEFRNSGNVWKGAVENTSLFDIWQNFPKLTHSTTHTFQSTEQPTLDVEIDPMELFRIKFENVLGPLLYEFKASGNVWYGAIENKALFEVWKRLADVIGDK